MMIRYIEINFIEIDVQVIAVPTHPFHHHTWIDVPILAGQALRISGKNGAGKSTMLKILSKDLEPDSGQIATDKHLKIGFLRQDIDFIQGRTVLEESYEAFQEIKVIEHQLETINLALAERTDYESESYNQLLIDYFGNQGLHP